MPRALVDRDSVLVWAPKTLSQAGGANVVLLESCIERASVAVESWSSRRFLMDTYTERHGGSRAVARGTRLYLRCFPVVGVPTVKESGVTLSVGTDPDLGPAVLLLPEEGVLERLEGTWAAGSANVLVTYQAGWTLDTMPGDVAQVVIELTWAMYREKDREGVSSVASPMGETRYRDRLSDAARHTLRALQRYGRPRTVAA